MRISSLRRWRQLQSTQSYRDSIWVWMNSQGTLSTTLTVNYIINLTLTSLSSTTNLNRAGFSFSIFNSGLLDMRAKNCFDCLETWIMRDNETENCYNSVNRKQLKNEANLQRGTAPDLLQMTAAATAEHKQNKPHCFFNLKSPPCACSWKYSYYYLSHMACSITINMGPILQFVR